MVTNKYILGGGISGLIFAYYHKDYKIITPEIGGKLKTKFISATTLLHKNEATIKLLRELKLPFDFIRHEIRYLTKDGYKKDITPEERIIMIRKKMTLAGDLPGLNPVPIVDTNLSTQTNFIELVSVNSYDLVNELTSFVADRIIIDKVEHITENKIICKHKEFDYDHIISTIPAHIFFKIYNNNQQFDLDLKHKSITMVVSSDLPYELKDKTSDFDLIYNGNPESKWMRMNKNGDKYLYEFTGIVTEDAIRMMFEDVDNYHIEHAGIIDSVELPAIKNIDFLGRFAMWNHKFKIHNAIKFAQEFKNDR